MKSTASASRWRRIAAPLIVASAIALISISIPARADDNGGRMALIGSGTRVTGSGKLATERRSVTGFEAIALRASMQLVLRADDHLLALIEAQVVDRGARPTQEIPVMKGSGRSTSAPAVATIDLATVSVTGSGDADVTARNTLTVSIAGRGSVSVSKQ